MERQTIFVNTQRPLSPKQRAILSQLHQYWYLLPEQVEKLNWKGKALTTAKAMLKALTEEDETGRAYVETIFLPKVADKARGRYRLAYRLGPRSLPYLRAANLPVPKRLNNFRQPEDPMHINHTFACNDVYINAALLDQYQDAVRLSRFIHEKTLHLRPTRVRLPNGTTTGFALDGALFFDIVENGEEFEQVMLLETDMGNDQEYWRNKLEKLLIYVQNDYKRDYDTTSFTFIVYSPTSDVHLANLIHWTEAFFAGRGATDRALAAYFYLTNVNASITDPVTFFLSPIWHQPFSPKLASPLEVGNG